MFHKNQAHELPEVIGENNQEVGTTPNFPQPYPDSQEDTVPSDKVQGNNQKGNSLTDSAVLSLAREAGALDKAIPDFMQDENAEHDMAKLESVIKPGRTGEYQHAAGASPEKTRIGPYDDLEPGLQLDPRGETNHKVDILAGEG